LEQITSERSVWNKETKSFVGFKEPYRFLKGPVPWVWVCKATKLPGKTLEVGLALWRLSGAMRSDTVRLTNKEMKALGVDRNAKSRALKQLQKSGLVSVQQDPGKIPRITIIHSD
jgi:hypothetical protein